MSDYPHDFSFFEQKTNAEFDGDPRGDYILAEHINELQDAVMAIERSVGLSPNKRDSLTTRIKQLERLQAVRVPSVGMFHTLHADTTYSASILDQYCLTILTTRSGGTASVISSLKRTVVYGLVNGANPLADIQNDMAAWKQIGAVGVRIQNFGNDSTRAKENDILRSAEEQGLKVLLQSTHWTRLLGNQSSQPYNPTGVPLALTEDMMAELNPFAYDGRARTPEELMAQTLPLLTSLRNRKLKVMGVSSADTSDLFNWTHGAAVLFGLDYLYAGRLQGEGVATRTPLFHSPSLLANWKTTAPAIFQEGSELVRRFENGAVRIGLDGKIHYDGLTASSRMLDWFDNSVPGSALKDGSVSPDKLSTYDIARIIQLINDAPEDMRIDPWKIGSDEGGENLPTNIPASNMIQNVIEAVNRKNNINTTEKQQIENSSIKSMDSQKLTGNLRKEVMQGEVVQAINLASNQTVFISVPRLDAINLNSTGTLQGNVLLGDNLTIRAGNVTEGLTTRDLTINQWVQGYDGEFYRLYIQHLEVDTISGLKDLHVENLTADNIGTLVIEAIEANITNGVFQTIVTHSLEADIIKAGLVTALNSITDRQITNSALFGEAVIKSANIEDLSVSKLRAGTLNTAQIHLSSPDGHLRILDDTISIYDDETAEGTRRRRVILGRLDEITDNSDDFGLVVLGPDGSTRLYDHTGVYSAGIHNNVISNDKIQDDAINDRVIQAGSIFAKHIQSETITADLIASEEILARHILADEINGGHIRADAIDASHIQSGSIETGHLTAGLIDAVHIKAGVITGDKLTIGFNSNLMRDGFDSFEQEPSGAATFVPLTSNVTTVIDETWGFDGRKSLRVNGPNAQNTVRLARPGTPYNIPVHPNNRFIVSAFTRTDGQSPTAIRLGLAFNNNSVVYSPVLQVEPGLRPTRLFHIFDIPSDALRANVVFSVGASFTNVYFDAIQIEEAEPNQVVPGPYRSTATTRIHGDNIQTGRIDARHIRIGTGTIFGTNNDIIDITDEGIKSRSQSGWAMLNSKGLEVEGGAFILRNGLLNDKRWEITGEGMIAETSHNRIELSPDSGFRLIDKQTSQILFDTDPATGTIRMAGTFMVYSPNNPDMAWSMDDKIISIEEGIDDTDKRVDDLNTDLGDTKDDLAHMGNRFNSYRQAQARRVDVRLGMKLGYSTFTTTHATQVYIAGIELNEETFQEELVDQPGSIYLRDTRQEYTVPNRALSVGNLPVGKTGYIAWDNTHQLLELIWHEVTYSEDHIQTQRWRTAGGQTKHLNQSVFILGEVVRD